MVPYIVLFGPTADQDPHISAVTYKTNMFRMPFAPFTCVNHHLQSILFRGALLENKTTEILVWLFIQFSRCMFDEPPTTIITDQDAAIINSLAKYSQSSDMVILCGVLVDMRSSICRDIAHNIQTSMRCIGDDQPSGI